MKRRISRLWSIVSLIGVFALVVSAQEVVKPSAGASKYVISAEAGGVSFIDGKVSVLRNVGRSGLLLKGDTVKIGERVSTDADSKAEVLLNPGSYIRIGGNSSFEFEDTSLENLKINLLRGSAIFEVITSDDFTFLVNTPKATFNVIKTGVYRVDVLADGSGKIEVWKGKALVGDDEDAEVKKGRTATVGTQDDLDVAKFDRGDRDSFEEWSRSRAKELAKANEKLERKTFRNTLISSFDMNMWSFYDTFGVWVFDPFYQTYCFMPFGYGWRSPYGFYFGRDIAYYRLPRYIYNQPPPVYNPKNPNNPPVKVDNETAGNNGPKTPAEPRKVLTPPYQRADGQDRPRPTRADPNDFPTIFPNSPRVPTSAPITVTPEVRPRTTGPTLGSPRGGKTDNDQ